MVLLFAFVPMYQYFMVNIFIKQDSAFTLGVDWVAFRVTLEKMEQSVGKLVPRVFMEYFARYFTIYCALI